MSVPRVPRRWSVVGSLLASCTGERPSSQGIKGAAHALGHGGRAQAPSEPQRLNSRPDLLERKVHGRSKDRGSP